MSSQSRSGCTPRLLLVGEGETEVGRAQSAREEPNLSGAVLPHFLDRILDRNTPPSSMRRRFEVASVRKFSTIPVMQTWNQASPTPRQLPRNSDSQRIRRAMFLAKQHDCDGVVVLIDREHPNQPDRRERMCQGRAAYRNDATDSAPACAIGAACRCSETWLLADSQARAEVLGPNAGDPFSGDPEQRPPPRVLKAHISNCCQALGLGQHEAREALARNARPAELRQRCSTSYPPFADDVLAEIAPLTSSPAD
ncbi:MAG: DUF4276 family protein [Candidatus Eisenbacteria bacterium]|nr:DUF4276 family protein [Candidatus Eisenbacteria bacterium]